MQKNFSWRLVGFLALGFVLWRFFALENAPFVYDEPIFQQMLSHHFATRTFPLLGNLGSSLPLQYGAGHLWFYAIPRAISDEVLVFVFFHTFVFSLGFLFLYLGTRRWQGENPARLAVLLAATAPYLLILSQHPWDNTLFVPISAVMFWIFCRLEESYLPQKKQIQLVALLALLVAYSANLHLSCGPLLLAAGFTYLVFVLRTQSRWSKRFLWLGLCGAAVVALVIPYGIELIRSFDNIGKIPTSAAANTRWGDARHFWWNLMGVLSLSSAWRVKQYLEPVYPDFLQFLGEPLAALVKNDVFSWLPKIAAFVFALAPIGIFICRRPGQNKIALPHIFLASAFVFFLLVQQYINIPTAPHYFLSFWFVWAIGMAVAWQGEGWFRWPLRISIVGMIVANIIFCIGFSLFIFQNHGTRGLNLGSGAYSQRQAAAQVCQLAKEANMAEAVIDLSAVFATKVATEYFLQHLPECKTQKIRAEKNPPHAQFRYIYPAASATDAQLLVEQIL